MSAAPLRGATDANVEASTSAQAGRAPALALELQRVRRTLGLSRHALATQTGSSAQTIWRYESGRSTPKSAYLRELERVAQLRDGHFGSGDPSGGAVPPERPPVPFATARAAADELRALGGCLRSFRIGSG
jgi:transcriptional regulator with XRE-family HTH domain